MDDSLRLRVGRPGSWLTTRPLIFTLAAMLLLSSPAVGSDPSKPQILPDDHPNKNDPLLTWALQKGGYWNPKQYIGIQDADIGLNGVLALDNIEEDELLVEIPWDAVITPLSYGPDATDEEQPNAKDPSLGGEKLHPGDARFFNCDTVQRLHDELESDQSQYAPYVSALRQTARDHYDLLPAHWSKAGQTLLAQVLGTDQNDSESVLPPLPPDDIFLSDFAWKPACEKVDKNATLLVMTHGEEFGMVPITDRYNSRGGSHEGAYFSMAGDTDNPVALEIRASRDLEKGEPITTAYYDDSPMGVPELLRDYGYIEPFPQKYIFHSQNLAFVLSEVDDEEEGDDGDERLEVHWLETIPGVRGKRYMHPKKGTTPPRQLYKALSYLHRHYDRLMAICPSLSNISETTAASKHELDMTLRYCNTMLTALEVALSDLDILPGEQEAGDEL